MSKLGIVVSHPIQYYAPLFRYLAKSIDLVVFYGHQPDAKEQGSAGFNVEFNWDVDLLSGYQYRFLKNKADKKKYGGFWGIDVPDIGHQIEQESCTHVLILGWLYKYYLQAYFYCRKNKIPMAVRGDSTIDINQTPLKLMMKKLIYPFFLNGFQRLLYVGQLNREYLRHYGVSESKLIFSPHAVDQEFWSAGSKSPRESNTFQFVWVGKFIDIKKPYEALEAFEGLLNNTELSMQLIMVGSGPLLEHCKEQYDHLQSIEFTGFQNQTELKEIYSSSDCLILTSRNETWGLVVNEAFAMGIPAIVSDKCGCVPDLLTDGTGLVYKYGKLSDLQRKMLEMINALNKDAALYRSGIDKKNTLYHFKSSKNAVIKFITEA